MAGFGVINSGGLLAGGASDKSPPSFTTRQNIPRKTLKSKQGDENAASPLGQDIEPITRQITPPAPRKGPKMALASKAPGKYPGGLIPSLQGAGKAPSGKAPPKTSSGKPSPKKRQVRAARIVKTTVSWSWPTKFMLNKVMAYDLTKFQKQRLFNAACKPELTAMKYQGIVSYDKMFSQLREKTRVGKGNDPNWTDPDWDDIKAPTGTAMDRTVRAKFSATVIAAGQTLGMNLP